MCTRPDQGTFGRLNRDGSPVARPCQHKRSSPLQVPTAQGTSGYYHQGQRDQQAHTRAHPGVGPPPQARLTG